MAGLGTPIASAGPPALPANTGLTYTGQTIQVTGADGQPATQYQYQTPGGQIIGWVDDGNGQGSWSTGPAGLLTSPGDPVSGLQEVQSYYPGMFGSSSSGSVGQPVSGTSAAQAAQNAASTAVLAPQAQLPTQDYVNEVTQALQPTFTQQNQALTEQLAGEGILNSGAASNQLQNLVGQQGSTIAGLVAPLLQQGNAQQQQTNLTNAGAQNSMIQQANQLSEQTGLANLSGAQALQQAQLGYSNQDYQDLLNALYGLTGGQQSAINQIAAGSVGQGASAYQSGETSTLPYLSSTGYGSGYGTGVGSPYYGTGSGVGASTGSDYNTVLPGTVGGTPELEQPDVGGYM